MRAWIEEVSSLGPAAADRLRARAAAAGVRAGDEPIGSRFAASPLVLDPPETAALDALGRAVHVVLRESLGTLAGDPALWRRLALGPRALWGVGRRFGVGHAQYAAASLPNLLLSHRAAQPDPIPRARADAFWIDGRPRVFEINVGPMICHVMDALAGAFAAEGIDPAGDGASAARASGALADALLRRHAMRFGDVPAVVGLTRHPDAESSDTLGLEAALRARGLDVRRVGPGELEFDGEALRASGAALTVLARECTSRPSTLARFGLRDRLTHKRARARALRAGAAIVYPAPYESVFHKGFLAMISDGTLEGRVDREALSHLRAHVAWTRVTVPGPVRWRDGTTAPLRELARRRRGELVLKPLVGHTSVGVLLGDRTERGRWEAAVDRALRRRDAVLQERLRPEPIEVSLLEPALARAHVTADLSPVFVDGSTAAVFSRFRERGELLHFLDAAAGEERGAHGLIPVWMRREGDG